MPDLLSVCNFHLICHLLSKYIHFDNLFYLQSHIQTYSQQLSDEMNIMRTTLDEVMNWIIYLTWLAEEHLLSCPIIDYII